MRRNMTVKTGKKIIKAVILAVGAAVLIAVGISLKTEKTELPLSQDGYYEIDSAQDYFAFWKKVNTDESGARGRLMRDICLNDTENYGEWSQNAPENRSGAVNFFYGFFDGNGHTIYGLYSETGYGLVERNRGQISNLTIKDSLIVGEAGEMAGGICRENYRLISSCSFEGEIIAKGSAGAYLDEAGGICCENTGTIEKCGFAGILNVQWSWPSGHGAGICPDNRGWIEGCYNAAELTDTPWLQGRFYAIADQKERSCIVFKGAGWLLSETGQFFELSRQQEGFIPALQEKDLYMLFVDRDETEGDVLFEGLIPWDRKETGDGQAALKELLEDELVKELVWQVLLNRDGALEQLKITPQEGGMCLSDGEETIFLGINPTAYGNPQDYEDGYERLWAQCGDILGERAEGWQHNTWHLGEVSAVGREFVLYQTEDGRQGFFWKQDERLYQVEESLGETADGRENMALINEIWDDEGEEEGQTWTEKTMYETMLWKLWENQQPTDGISWESPAVRDAVYKQLTGNEESIPPWEDLRKIEKLTVTHFDRISSLRDLEKLPDLKELHLEGNYKAQVSMDLTKEMAPKLRDLYISNVELQDITFLEQLPQLDSLYIVACGVEDISPIQCQKNLWDVSFYGNSIENIWPLRNCKKLQILSLSYNNIEDITALASLSKLEEIGLAQNRISNIEALQWLPRLKKVNFNCNQVSDLTPLAEQTGLVGLGAYDNQISDITPLKKLTELENLSLDVNEIQDISVLKDMSKLQYLGLSGNEILDFTPALGLDQLVFLSVGDNPGQDIGDLIFVPHLGIGNGSFYEDGEKQKEAQSYLDLYYSEKELLAEDMVTGDLNGDGLSDVVVLGLSQTCEDEVYDDRRKAYPLLAKPEGGFEQITPIMVSGPDSGGIYGDPYQGMLISNGRLVIQIYGGSSWRWGYTDIYEYENGEMISKWELKIEHCTHTSGYNYQINNLGNGSGRFYAIAGQWEQTVRMLLLEEWNGSLSKVEREFKQMWEALLSEEELTLPSVHAAVYQPEIVEGGYGYQYVIHHSFFETEKTPEEALLTAAEECLKDYRRLPVVCYTTEEIKNNFDCLAGVELPEYFYFGYSEYGIPELVVYKGCSVNEDGSYTHKCSVWLPADEYWVWDRDIYYEEQ